MDDIRRCGPPAQIPPRVRRLAPFFVRGAERRPCGALPPLKITPTAITDAGRRTSRRAASGSRRRPAGPRAGPFRLLVASFCNHLLWNVSGQTRVAERNFSTWRPRQMCRRRSPPIVSDVEDLGRWHVDRDREIATEVAIAHRKTLSTVSTGHPLVPGVRVSPNYTNAASSHGYAAAAVRCRMALNTGMSNTGRRSVMTKKNTLAMAIGLPVIGVLAGSPPGALSRPGTRWLRRICPR